MVQIGGRKAKPLAVNKKNLTKAEKKKREAAEKLLQFNNDCIRPPDWLDGEIAIEEWIRVTKELKEKNLITNVDISALALGCDALQLCLDAKKEISKYGQTYIVYDREGNRVMKKNPSITIHQDYAKLYKSFCSEFGLTPSARIRLTLPTIEVKTDENPLRTLLKLKHGT